MSQSQGNGTLLASLRGSHALLDSSLPPHPGSLIWYVPTGPFLRLRSYSSGFGSIA